MCNQQTSPSTHTLLDRILQRSGNLPAAQIAQEVNRTLEQHSGIVITAPPGAGKSTLLPLAIMAGTSKAGKILMLEPRRLAARQIAERMAEILDQPVGQTVGYRVRFENKVSTNTRIEVITEGILTRMLIDDATLDGISVVIFDEFHERSINSDLALALTLQAQHVIRPDLKIVIMSATIDASQICQSLHFPLIESQGRMFPVHLVYAAEELDACKRVQATAATIMKAHREQEGDILVFLPGQGEITKCAQLLGNSLAPTQIYPLYAHLSPKEQRCAIAPSKPGERKVVLATPIAETSITIEGVRTVIDTGLCRSLVFDARTGLSHLETVKISMDMATQRMGRAGRVAKGTCYRLWTKASEHLMAPQRCPEITNADLAPLVLSIAAFGESNIEELPWLTPPPTGNVSKAQQLLRNLGAIGTDGHITALGKEMAALPCHPRIAKMMLSAHGLNMKALACDVAALLEEKDPLAGSTDSDITIRLATLRSARRNKQLGRWNNIAQIAKEYRKMMQIKEDNTDMASQQTGLLVAYAYPERVAIATDHIGNLHLANGNRLQLECTDSLSAYKWLAIASLYAISSTTGKVFLAAPVDIEDLNRDFVSTQRNITWDSKQGCIIAQEEQRIGRLVISSKPIHETDKQQIIRTICEAVKKEGLSMLNWSEEVQRLQRRVAQVTTWHPEMNIPDLNTKHLMDTAQQWLPFYLEQGDKIKQNTSELKKINLCEVLWALIPYDIQQDINRLAPTHITVPTGNRIRIDYRTGAEAPVLSVRLQECFGLLHTPCINDGQQPILMELLSPGFKPVQLTQDLHSFWKGTYFEVRKELKRRYPKHYWPEKPLEAEAVKGIKKKQ